MREDDPRGPHRRRDHALAHDPVADRPGRLVTAAADHGGPGPQPGRLRPQVAHPAGDLGTLVARRQERRVDPELLEQLAAPSAVGDVEHQGPRGVAHLGGVGAGQSVADVILGQEHLPHPLPMARLVPADPQQLGRRESGQGRVGDHPDEGLAAPRLVLDLAALLGRALVVPEQGRADDRARLVEEHRAVHLPAQADAGDVLRTDFPGGQHPADRLDRRVPPEVGMLLRPAGPGVVAGILGGRRGEDRPPFVDGQRLGPGGADVDAEGDAHGVISQRSPQRRIRASTPGGSRRASDTNASTGTVLKVNRS